MRNRIYTSVSMLSLAEELHWRVNILSEIEVWFLIRVVEVARNEFGYTQTDPTIHYVITEEFSACMTSKNEILLNKDFVMRCLTAKSNTYYNTSMLRKTFLHELAHSIVGREEQHSRKWEDVFYRLCKRLRIKNGWFEICLIRKAVGLEPLVISPA